MNRIDILEAEALVLEFGLTEWDALRDTRVQLVGRGFPEHLVVPWRSVWVGSVLPLSATWSKAVGMFGGAAAVDAIAGQIGRPVVRTQSALNARLLYAVRGAAQPTDQFDIAVGVYRATLASGAPQVARQFMLMKHEVGLYARRMMRCLADLGATSIEEALDGGAMALRGKYDAEFALRPEFYARPWTPSPSAMWTLPAPTWWW